MSIQAFINVLPIIGYGMLGIFIVIFVIYIFVKLLNKIFKPGGRKQ